MAVVLTAQKYCAIIVTDINQALNVKGVLRMKTIIMEIKKVTYEDALARFKRSLENKRNAERRMAEEWKKMGLTGTIVSL